MNLKQVVLGVGLTLSSAIFAQLDNAKKAYEQGIIALEAGKFTTATTHLKQAISYKETFIPPYFTIAGVYELQGNYPRAMAYLLDCLYTNKENTDAKKLLEHIWREQGAPENNLDTFITHMYTQTHLVLGDSLRAIGKEFDTIRKEYTTKGKQAPKLTFDSREVYATIATKIISNSIQEQQQQNHAQEFKQLDLRWTQFYLDMNQYKDALTELKKYQEQYPNNPLLEEKIRDVQEKIKN
ncbi:hypothetical protein K9M74_03865 [Candidatus Woesearchaeota archaeon]|nr:hypothetical protein [Candidatus Woesearchaeota archaeon]